MSKIALTPSATGTGVFTISSPATNTDRTLTLPDEAGTVLTSASSLASDNLTGPINVNASAPNQAVTLDSSGNLLVGKTSANTSTVGVEALANGEMNATVNGGRVISLDRLGSDGEIIRIRKSSSTVGSIGVSNSGTALYI